MRSTDVGVLRLGRAGGRFTKDKHLVLITRRELMSLALNWRNNTTTHRSMYPQSLASALSNIILEDSGYTAVITINPFYGVPPQATCCESV